MCVCVCVMSIKHIPQYMSEVICLGVYKSKVMDGIFQKLANLKETYFHILPYYYIFFLSLEDIIEESGRKYL